MPRISDRSALHASRPALPSGVWEKLEQILERFEDAWRRGDRPNVGDFLQGTGAPRLALLIELVHEDLDYRLRAGEAVRVATYLERYPELRADPAVALNLIIAEFELRQVQQSSTRPRWPDFLSQADEADRPALLRRLLVLDLQYRVEHGEQPTPEEYQHHLPEHATLIDSVFGVFPTGPGTPPDTGGAGTPVVGVTASPAPRKSTTVSVPGYEILGKLGEGGMGVVYKARQIQADRLVALKMILHGDHVGEAARERFRTEAQSIARLQHPHIVQIHEIGEVNGLPFFSLEFCPGGSLDKKLQGTPLPPQEAAALVETLARAMDAAHNAGVVHRDLKPANVLLDKNGQPKVTDFGLAKKVDEAGQTASGAVMGSPSYMAPEQAGGRNKEVGPAADVYALGAILYECLTGRPPFKAATVMDTLLQVLQDEPVSPRQLNAKMPLDLETICLKCLGKSVTARFSTASALADDLRRYRAGEPILARPIGTVERLWRWCRRKPTLAASTGLAGFGVLLALVVFAGAFFMVSGALDNETNERKKAERLAEEKKMLAENEKKLADAYKLLAERERMARQEAEALAIRVQFEHYFSKAEDRPDLALVGTASLLPKAARLKDQSVADSLRLHIAIWSRGAAQLNGICTHPEGALSADGKTALMSEHNTARLWETATGKPIGPPLQHQGVVVAMALSADGKTALTLSADGKAAPTGRRDMTARLWETATGKPIGPPLLHQGAIRAVALSADGKTALTGTYYQQNRFEIPKGEAFLWETASGKATGLPLRNRGVVAVALSADGKTALTAIDCGSDFGAQAWETATGKPIGPRLQQDDIRAMALSADGKTALILSRAGDNRKDGPAWGKAQLWETATGKAIGPPLPHQGVVLAIALSGDGKTALTGSDDKTARLWDVTTGKPIGPPLQHQDGVNAVALSGDGKTALTGSDDKTARLWDATTGKPIGPPLQHQDQVLAVALSSDGKTALTGNRFWQTATDSNPIGLPLQHQDRVTALVLSADGKTALTGSWDKTARIWDAATGKPIGPPLQHRLEVQAVALSADGKTALTGSIDATDPYHEKGEARLWERATGKPIGPPLQTDGREGPTSLGLPMVALSADGKTGLTASHGKTARLWQMATGNAIGPPLQHQDRVVAVALSADGKTALTGSLDKTARLWDAATGKPIGLPLQHQYAVRVVALSADGKTALTGSDDKTARIWDAATGKPIGLPLQHQDQVLAGALSSDGKTALTGSWDKTARLWDATTGKAIGPPLQHRDRVVAVALSADGKTALTGSNDKTAHLWETMTGKPIGLPLQHQYAVPVVALSADGKTALTGSYEIAAGGGWISDKAARLWHVPQAIHGDPERIILWAQVITGLEVDELTAVHVLDAANWQQRRQHLQELGGPPDNGSKQPSSAVHSVPWPANSPLSAPVGARGSAVRTDDSR